MKNIMTQALNKVTIVGKLLNVNFRDGKTNDGKSYSSGTATIRCTQTYFGNEETSEVAVGFWASALTGKGTANPAYESIQKLRELKTAQNVGIDLADTIRINSASIGENMFIAKNSNQLVDIWNLRASFFTVPTTAQNETATFCTDVYVLDKREELDKEGVETGRIILRGGIVQYNGKLDIVDFIAEDPEVIDHVNRNWEVDTTINIKGRIRATVKEETRARINNSSWGEAIPDNSEPKIVRELIICTGSEAELDEEQSYDSTEIKKAFSERKARIEQLRMDAQNPPVKATPVKKSKYDWEEE